MEDNNVEALLEVCHPLFLVTLSCHDIWDFLLIFLVIFYFQGLIEAREELRPLLSRPNNRLKDLLFLDIALDSTVRTAVERGYEELNTSNPEVCLIYLLLIVFFSHRYSILTCIYLNSFKRFILR